jgi:acyl-coenzyme A thioesterase PaaI-like protein
MKQKIGPKTLSWVMSLWPPFLGAGISVQTISDDWRYGRVRMVKRFYNTNYFGVHFGGSLFSMTDGLLVILYTQALGREYIVWDKGASIKFIQPGKDHVYAEFKVCEKMLDKIKAVTENGEKFEPVIEVEVVDPDGQTVALVSKTLYFRRKSKYIKKEAIEK